MGCGCLWIDVVVGLEYLCKQGQCCFVVGFSMIVVKGQCYCVLVVVVYVLCVGLFGIGVMLGVLLIGVLVVIYFVQYLIIFDVFEGQQCSEWFVEQVGYCQLVVLEYGCVDVQYVFVGWINYDLFVVVVVVIEGKVIGQCVFW